MIVCENVFESFFLNLNNNALLHEIVTAVPVTVLYKVLFRAQKHLQTFVSNDSMKVGKSSQLGKHGFGSLHNFT